MTLSEEENKKAKKDIKSALAKGDLTGVLKAGIDNFFNILCSSKPMTFQQFIEYTGIFHDKFILDTCKQEHLNYVGGKMLIELERNNAEAVPIQLCADFYFQKPNQEWVMKKRKGHINSSSITDWDTNEMAANLRETGRIEFSIEMPE
ncbi:MAG: hypothetical protein K2I96_23125 [Lachnospiraceae bacterium]|nr:hypothetical protein [Lachnospiraceae bacterium]